MKILTVFSVTTRNFPWIDTPAPPPMQIPSRRDTFRNATITMRALT